MTMTNQTPYIPERRQVPRVRCGGSVKIIGLPSQGLSMPGKVLNLCQGGCGIEIVSPLSAGTRAEFVLHVGAASIRVLGEVRETRGPNVVGVKFLMVSAGGKHLLADLIQHLVREQAMAALRKTALRQKGCAEMPKPRPPLWDGRHSQPNTRMDAGAGRWHPGAEDGRRKSFAEIDTDRKHYNPAVGGYSYARQWRGDFKPKMGWEEAAHVMAGQKRTPCQILGVATHATWEQIVKAYRKAAMECHPDRAIFTGMTNEAATAAFNEVTAAYRVLAREFGK